MTDAIKTYTVSSAASIESAMKASSGSTRAGEKVKKDDGIVWNQAVIFVGDNVDLSVFAQDTDDDNIKKIGNALKSKMAEHIHDSVEIPAIGKNRQMKDFDVVDGKTGLVKWSSWAETRRIWDYLGSIAKCVAFGIFDDVYPEPLKVGARNEALKLCKVPENHMKAIERLSAALQDNLDIVKDGTEVHEAHMAISGLTVNNLDPVPEAQVLIQKLDGLLSCMDDAEKAGVLADMGRFSRHFTTPE